MLNDFALTTSQFVLSLRLFSRMYFSNHILTSRNERSYQA